MKAESGAAGQTAIVAGARLLTRLLARTVFQLRLHGLENIPSSGPVLVAGNHSSFLDGPLVFVVLPRPSAFLVKSEMFRSAWLSWALGYLRQIPVRRGRPDRSALRRALDVLAAGGVLGVFPEGTRGAGTLEDVQHGVGYLALRAKCPVVPVVCLGTAAALPKGRRLPRWRIAVDVVFGAPFTVDVPGDPHARSTIAAAAEDVRQHLLAHLAQASVPAEPPPGRVSGPAGAPVGPAETSPAEVRLGSGSPKVT